MMRLHLVIYRQWVLIVALGLCLQAGAVVDSVLWQDMRLVGRLFRQAQYDSAMSIGYQTLRQAEQKGDLRAQVLLCSVMCAQCYDDKQYQEVYDLTVKGERAWNALGEAKTANATMARHVATLYTYMAIAADQLGNTQEARRAARLGVAWLKRTDSYTQAIAGTNLLSEILLRDDTVTVNGPYTDVTHQPLPNTPAPPDALKTDAPQPPIDTIKTIVEASRPDSIAKLLPPSSTANGQKHYLLLAVVLAVILVIGYLLWQRRRQRKQERRLRQQMAEQYLEGQEQERSRLARELHDSVSNQLLAVEMKMKDEGLTPQTMQLLNESREQVRRVSHELLPPEFEHANLDQAMASYIASLKGLKRWEVSYTCGPADADWAAVPTKTALEVYRIAQESVANIQKHAQATTIAIGLHLNGGNHLELTVSDDGTWKSGTDASEGIGIRTMRQRANAIDAELDFVRHPYGNTVSLAVDCDKKC